MNHVLTKQDQAYQDFLRRLEPDRPIEKKIGKEFISKAILGNYRTLFAQVYDGSQASVEKVRSLYNSLHTKPDEMTFYENTLPHPVTVTCHRNIPRVIEPASFKQNGDDVLGKLVVKTFIFLRGKEALERASLYVSSIDTQSATPEDLALKTYADKHLKEGLPVLYVEYEYSAKDMADRKGVVYDPMLNLMVQYGTGAMDGFVNHPGHTYDANNTHSTFNPNPLPGVTVKFTTEKKAPSLFIKLGPEVIELKPKVGKPVIVKSTKTTAKLDITTEYISITTREPGGEQRVKHYSVDYAKEHMGVFDSRQMAENAGNYSTSDTAKWKQAQATHDRELELRAQSHRQELEKQAQTTRLGWEEKFSKLKHASEQALNEERLLSVKALSDIKLELETYKRENILLVKQHETELARQRELDEKREHAHKAEIEKIKLEQQRQSFVSDRASNSSRNTGDGIKLALAVVTAVASVGAIVFKLFF